MRREQEGGARRGDEGGCPFDKSGAGAKVHGAGEDEGGEEKEE